MRLLFFPILCLCLWLSIPCQSQYKYAWQMGAQALGQTQFVFPTEAAIDQEGNIYVVDTEQHAIQKFTREGEFLLKFGGYGITDSLLYQPASIVIDSEGNLFVGDKRARIQKFDKTGKFLFRFGSIGRATGQFANEVSSLIIDQEGNLYAADYGNARIQKFSAQGEFLFAFGSYGSGNGQFIGYADLALNTEGNIFVAELFNNRVQKFSPSGDFLFSFGSYGYSDEEFNHPSDIAIDAQGNLYVTEQLGYCVKKFTKEGVFLSKFGVMGTSAGQFMSPYGIAIDKQGDLYITDRINDNVQKFDTSGRLLLQIGHKFTETQFTLPLGIALDKQNNIYIDDTGNNRVQILTSHGEFVRKFGSIGIEDGKFYTTRGIAVNEQGMIYVVETSKHQVSVFSPTGEFISKFGGPGETGEEDGKFSTPNAIAIDSKGFVYVLNSQSNCVQKFTSSGVFVSKFGSPGSGDGQFFSPEGIAIDAQDQLYICDFSRYIQKFTSDGEFLSKFGGFGAADGKFYAPSAIAIDREGNVFVTDKGKHCIQKFTKEGIFLEKIGSYGSKGGELFEPEGIAVDTQGNLYVADTDNNRIQKFTRVRKPALKMMVDTSQVANQTVFKLDSTTYGNTLSVNITLDNTKSMAPLVISDVVLPQQSRLTSKLPDTIAAGISETLNLQITAKNSGKYVGSLSFKSNDTLQPFFSIYFETYIKKATQEITFHPITTKTYGQPAFVLPATVSSGLPVHYSSSNESVAVIENNRVHFVGAGTATLRAIQPGDTNYLATQAISQLLTVEKATQSIQFELPSSLPFKDSPIALEAKASSGLEVMIEVISGPAIVRGNTLSLLGIGPLTLQAVQEGNSNYLPAEIVTQSICILPLTPTISSTGSTLTSSSSEGNQWYLDGELIEGAIQQELPIREEGNYQVAKQGPCGEAVWSAPFRVSLSATQELLANAIQIYPNPTINHVLIALEGSLQLQKVCLLSLQGQIIKLVQVNDLKQMHLPLSDYKSGTYIVEIHTDKGILRKKVVKQ